MFLKHEQEPVIIALGNHVSILQSILDFDFCCGKTAPSIAAIVTTARKSQKLFWGDREVLIPCVPSLAALPAGAYAGRDICMLNMDSARRVLESTTAFLAHFPDATLGHIFAEDVPEQHALAIDAQKGNMRLFGPSGVGLLIPGRLKLGAIGGIDATQMLTNKLMTKGSIAVISASGGMTNELVSIVAHSGRRISFAATVGGERFPLTTPAALVKDALDDPETEAVLYFGELGGSDEYDIADLLRTTDTKKPVLAYIAGIIEEGMDEHVQFGHAKALAATREESARAKRDVLAEAGARVPETFSDFVAAINELPVPTPDDPRVDATRFTTRRETLFTTRRPRVHARTDTTSTGTVGGFSRAVLATLLGKEPHSSTVACTDEILTLLIDHGGHVSGAVNTMVTARAGKDMVTSLASGLLTIGPRFGGAINAAAGAWLEGVGAGTPASAFVESYAKAKNPIPGIGHRKYRIGMPDPRTAALLSWKDTLTDPRYTTFAQAVERETTAKKGNLILNVDGTVAALMLDMLAEYEGYDEAALRELVATEFFNTFFIIARSVGFISHYLEQKRNDEGLFRLPDDLLFERDDTAQPTQEDTEV